MANPQKVLEELLRQEPDNPDLLYNLGLFYVDLSQLNRGIELLLRCQQIAPQHSRLRGPGGSPT